MKRLIHGAIALSAIAMAGSVRGECPRPVAATALSETVDAAQLERNKDVVKALFAIIFGGTIEDISKIDQLVAADYIQHHPGVGQGREALRQGLMKIMPGPKGLPPSDTIWVNYVAEGDYVVRQEMRKNGMLVDIFRLKDGMLQEHWDAFRFAPGAERIPGF